MRSAERRCSRSAPDAVAPRSITAGGLEFVKPYASNRRIAARNLVATLVAVASLTVISSSGHAQQGGALATQQKVIQPGSELRHSPVPID